MAYGIWRNVGRCHFDRRFGVFRRAEGLTVETCSPIVEASLADVGQHVPGLGSGAQLS